MLVTRVFKCKKQVSLLTFCTKDFFLKHSNLQLKRQLLTINVMPTSPFIRIIYITYNNHFNSKPLI